MRKQKKVILHFAALSLAILLGSAKAEAQNYYAANTKRAVKAGFIAALEPTSKSAFETITGKITDKSGNGIAGVSVTVKGKGKGTSSGADGSFSINANKGDVLIFSSVGFETQQVTVGNDNTISVQLVEKSGQMNEVVVTALGIQRDKRSLSYATQKVGGEKMSEAREINIINGLQGKVAGITIAKNAAGPGSSTKVILRGNRSIDGNNQPLYVIDGVPLDNSTRSQPYGGTFGGRDGGDGIGMINPDEVESMQILKGPAAAALYGSAGQNGAIIISTKRGKAGKISLDYTSGVMFDKASVLPELQNEYGQGDGGIYVSNSEHSFGAKISGQRDTLWNGSVLPSTAQTNRLKEFFRTAQSLTNSIAATGGSDKMQTYFFYGNTDATGILRNHTYKRHNFTLRVSNNITSKLTIDSKISYIYEDVHNKPFVGEAPNAVISMYRAPVTIPLSEMRKSENQNASGVPSQSYWRPNSSILENPYWIMSRESFYERKDRVIGLISARYQINDALNFQVRGSIDKTIEKSEEKISQDSYFTTVGSNYLTNTGSHYGTNIDALLNYKYKISKYLGISGNVGGSVQQSTYEGTSANARGLNKPNFFFMQNAKSAQLSNNIGDGPMVRSLYATATLAYRNYLFLDVTGRNDWSSALPINNASYFYPSVGVTAIVSDIVAMPSWVSYGKVRAGVAGAGNGGNAYNLAQYYTIGAGGAPTPASIRALANFKPELTSALEFGLEWRFLDNRIGFDLAIYNSKTTNQLLKVKIPQASLFDSKYINAGLIENKGVELMLTGTPLRTKNLSWDVTLNYSTNKNKVVRLDPLLKTAILIEDRDADIVVKEGGRYGDLYVQDWKKDSLGRRLVNANGRMIKTDGKTELLGNYNPDWALGLNNTFTYKAFSFSFLIDHRQGGYVISGTQALIDADGHSKQSLLGRGGFILDAVKADGSKNGTVIQANEHWSDIGDRYPVGGLYAYSATNTRLREVTLGYMIPDNIVKKTKFIRAAKFSLVGRNLFFFKRIAPYDPELNMGTGNNGGLEYGSLPATRSMGLNLKLSF
jgi:TonB-linked SusC/RagA family outer membrane protein